jgi:GTPase-associated system helical domain
MTMLQKFLNHQLINIAEDENLNKLKKSCDDIVKKLAKNKSKVISYTLVALDPEILAENAEVKEVNEIILKHWKTFIPNAKDTPLTAIRAVILESLQKLADSDINFACQIWLTGRNAIKYFRLGREKDLLCEFLTDIGNKVESEAEKQWSLNAVSANLSTEGIFFEVGEPTEI